MRAAPPILGASDADKTKPPPAPEVHLSVAEPQRISFHGTFYVPVDMEPVRPGANDHLKYKSRTSVTR